VEHFDFAKLCSGIRGASFSLVCIALNERIRLAGVDELKYSVPDFSLQLLVFKFLNEVYLKRSTSSLVAAVHRNRTHILVTVKLIALTAKILFPLPPAVH
jgi:hypothetical protein